MSVLLTYEKQMSLPRLLSMAKTLILLGLASIMLCVPVLNKCFWAAIILILFEGSWKRNWQVLLKDRMVIAGLLLMILFTVGIIYSSGSWNYALRVWDKYLKIFYLLFFLPFFVTQKMRQQALLFFLASVMVSEIFVYLHYFNILTLGFPPSKHWLFVQDIDSGFIVSFATYMLANLALDDRKYRWLYIFCLLVCSVDILILNQERTGYLIFFALSGLFLIQRFHWKGVVSAMLIVPLLFTSIYFQSDKFRDRVDQVASNILDYQNGNEVTSIGLRLAFAEYSFKVIQKNLFFGAGTGSFEETYRSLNGPKINNETWPAHPHNEYISILFQLGLVGLSVFIYWIYLQIKASFQLPRQERILVQGLIFSFLLLGFCNASLLVNPAGACYVVFLAILFAAKYERRGT